MISATNENDSISVDCAGGGGGGAGDVGDCAACGGGTVCVGDSGVDSVGVFVIFIFAVVFAVVFNFFLRKNFGFSVILD